MIPQLSSETNEHYTPRDVVERARALMSSIDLDPASCLEANETVRATKIFTQAENGLAQTWHGNVFLNPPGGRIPGVKGSQAAMWWGKLVEEWLAGNVEQAFFVGFTLEILRTSQSARFPVQCFQRCYPKSRMRFRGASPTHANVLVWVPPIALTRDHDPMPAFRAKFEDLGYCE